MTDGARGGGSIGIDDGRHVDWDEGEPTTRGPAIPAYFVNTVSLLVPVGMPRERALDAVLEENGPIEAQIEPAEEHIENLHDLLSRAQEHGKPLDELLSRGDEVVQWQDELFPWRDQLLSILDVLVPRRYDVLPRRDELLSILDVLLSRADELPELPHRPDKMRASVDRVPANGQFSPPRPLPVP